MKIHPCLLLLYKDFTTSPKRLPEEYNMTTHNRSYSNNFRSEILERENSGVVFCRVYQMFFTFLKLDVIPNQTKKKLTPHLFPKNDSAILKIFILRASFPYFSYFCSWNQWVGMRLKQPYETSNRCQIFIKFSVYVIIGLLS